MNNLDSKLDNIVNLLEDWLIFKEYTVNGDDDLITQTKIFILRYRRIIGITIIIILLYVGLNCNFGNENYLQKGGSKIGSIISQKTANSSIKKAQQELRTKVKQEKTQVKADAIKQKYDDSSLGQKMQKYKQLRATGVSRTEILGKGALNTTYSAGAWVGNTFKEYAGWLYEILFAVAISIAICMVVLPSISFVIIGLICFFLLKSKISSFKSI